MLFFYEMVTCFTLQRTHQVGGAQGAAVQSCMGVTMLF